MHWIGPTEKLLAGAAVIGLSLYFLQNVLKPNIHK